MIHNQTFVLILFTAAYLFILSIIADFLKIRLSFLFKKVVPKKPREEKIYDVYTEVLLKHCDRLLEESQQENSTNS